jgi:hypothetical protein
MASATKPMFTQPPPDVVPAPAGVKFVPFGLGEQKSDVYTLIYEPHSTHRPERILLGTLGDLGFRVIKPIVVNLEPRDTTVVASWLEIDEFGTGSSTSLAAEDLGRTVAELYRSLHNDQDKLGPDLRRVWVTLQEHILPRR